MAERGFIVFANQGVMTGDEQVFASKLWGAKEMHSTHSMYPTAPDKLNWDSKDFNKDIFRLSNDLNQGINGVGP